MKATDESVAALAEMVNAVRDELTDRAVSYTLGDRSVTFYGDGLGRLIQATLRAEAVLTEVYGRADKVRQAMSLPGGE